MEAWAPVPVPASAEVTADSAAVGWRPNSADYSARPLTVSAETTLATTQLYTHVTVARLRAVHDQAHPRA